MINPDDSSFWRSGKGKRLVQFPAVRLIIALLFFVGFVGTALGITSLIKANTTFSEDSIALQAIQLVLTSSFSIAGYWVFCRWVENRTVHEMDLEKMGKQTGLGFLLGFVFISIIILVIAILGGYQVKGFNPVNLLIPVLIMSLQAGIVEEILSRGIIFRITEEGIGTWWAVLFSAFVFGFLHSWNANATFFSSLSIALTAGLILAMLYVITRQLWIPIGLHIGWNFTLGGIYGAPVSGGEPAGLLSATLQGPEWLTGGSFGPEASVVTVAVFILFGLFLIRKSIRDKSYIKPMWRIKHDSNSKG